MLCFTMEHNSSLYQLKINYYRDKLWYTSLMISIEEKPMANKHTKKEKEMSAYHQRKLPNHKGRKHKKKEMERNYNSSHKTISKMAVSTYILIITLNVSKFSNQKTWSTWIGLKKKKQTRLNTAYKNTHFRC